MDRRGAETVIEIKQNKCVIQIYDDAYLSEMTVPKFRKLLKMAANERQNDPEKIRAEILETLERERIERKKDLERTDTFYSSREKNYTISRLKKIEKMKSEVQKYV
jgi:hypothetical protein